eukprot:GHVP01001659.1.p1 GENE.GHVP01001659.1~~GHVP01001659.1.p1  ORF type:complete len:122 (+),score=22.46 GHVP01001659.1:82-447(+)
MKSLFLAATLAIAENTITFTTAYDGLDKPDGVTDCPDLTWDNGDNSEGASEDTPSYGIAAETEDCGKLYKIEGVGDSSEDTWVRIYATKDSTFAISTPACQRAHTTANADNCDGEFEKLGK